MPRQNPPSADQSALGCRLNTFDISELNYPVPSTQVLIQAVQVEDYTADLPISARRRAPRLPPFTPRLLPSSLITFFLTLLSFSLFFFSVIFGWLSAPVSPSTPGFVCLQSFLFPAAPSSVPSPHPQPPITRRALYDIALLPHGYSPRAAISFISSPFSPFALSLPIPLRSHELHPSLMELPSAYGSTNGPHHGLRPDYDAAANDPPH